MLFSNQKFRFALMMIFSIFVIIYLLQLLSKYQMKVLFILLVIVLSIAELNAKDIIVYGKVQNQSSFEPINAANVRAIEQKRRVYTNLKGVFRLPMKAANASIEVSALGYNSKTITIDKLYSGDTLLIFLDANPIQTGAAIAYGDIEPKDVIKRAIARKQENLNRIQTVRALLYSKLYFDVNGSALNSATTDSRSISISAGSGKDEMPSTALMETFANKYVDKKKGIDFTKIIQRRQTANVPADNNIISFTEFVNLYDDEIKLLDVTMPTPLASNATDFYRFSIISKTQSDERIIYNMGLTPRNSASPGFTGTISIIEGTYELIEANLRPSDATAISFVDSLNYLQKFTNVNDSIWYPTYLEVNFNAGVKIIEGFAEIDFKAKAVSIINEIEINTPLPDSIYKYKSERVVRVDKEADSVKAEYWEQKALISLNEYEKKVYAEVDSVMAKIKSEPLYNSPFKFDASPYINFNRVESISAGLKPDINFFGIPIKGTMFYSFGLKDFYGDFEIKKQGRIAETIDFGFSVGAFSNIDRFSFDRSYDMFTNTLSAAFLHFDYYDYYYKSGFRSSVFAKYFDYFDISITYESSRQSSLSTNTHRSIFEDKTWRVNPAAINGHYELFFGTLKLGHFDMINPTGNFDWQVVFKPFSGSCLPLFGNFQGITAEVSLNIPLFSTGYKPISLALYAKGGISDNDLPPQYQFRMASSLAIYGKLENFLTAQPGEFGGMSFWEVLAEFKLSDYLWREIGLPLFNKRGIEFTLFGSIAKYYSNNSPIIYEATENKIFAEVGFGFFRMPIPKTNLIFWNFNSRFGVGELAKGRYEWSVGLELPF